MMMGLALRSSWQLIHGPSDDGGDGCVTAQLAAMFETLRTPVAKPIADKSVSALRVNVSQVFAE